MCCRTRWLSIAALVTLAILANPTPSQAQDRQQSLRDRYQGKTFVLRGFHSAKQLRYDRFGTPDSAAAGDWTEDGFVLVEDIHANDDRLTIRGQRLVANFYEKQFQLHQLEEQEPGTRARKTVVLKIEADFPQHNPSPEQVDELMSKIFLTANDHFADLVPDYWKLCVSRGLAGEDKNCHFSQEILAVPGTAPSAEPDADGATSADPRQTFRIGKGVSPPRALFQKEPEFTESARVAKFKGTVTLGLTVDKDGVPTRIRILSPLGSGLDAKAVQAVESWKFEPARKDGEPVAVEIAVEVDFHLY